VTDYTASGKKNRADKRATNDPTLEERREQLAARTQSARERSNEAKQQLQHLASMGRSFARTMRTTAIERKRLAEEREQLLERERAARAEAEASRKQMFDVLESIGDAFFAVDRERRFTYVNRRAERLWGRSRSELLGRNIWEEFPQEAGSEFYREVERAAKEGVTTEFETISPVLGAWIAGRAYPSGTGLSVYFQDVTERKRNEEERERLLARELLAYAAAEERQRISRELHDRVAHSMAIVHQSLQLYKVLLPGDPLQAEAKLALASEMAKKSLDSTRNLAMALRDPVADGGLEAALLGLLEKSVEPNIETDLSIEGDEFSVPTPVREQLFLILREAVRNAVSHSGCRKISVLLDVMPEKITGIVEDDGQGFTPEEPGAGAHGTGLESMKERATLVGGSCSVRTEPNKGTRVQVSIPLSQEG
jgi:PAS domain S-box-containing protein